MSLKAVLFDLDGTLMDTIPDVNTALNKLLTEEGKEHVTEERARILAANGLVELMTNAFHMEATHPDFESLRARFLLFYQHHASEKTKYYEGIEPSVAYIKEQGWGYGIVTNKTSLYTNKIVEDLGIQLDAVICPEHVAKPKPDPDGLLLACSQIGCRPEEAIFVGDHERDVIAGKAINMPTAAAAWGYIPATDKIEDWNADYYLETPHDLLPLLKTLASETA